MTNRRYVILFSTFYIILMALVAVFNFVSGNAFSGSIGLAGMLCGAVPALLTVFKRFRPDLPLAITYLIFLFGSQFLGSVLGFYRIHGWDKLVHGLSGVVLAFAAIALYRMFVGRRDAGQRISPWFLFLFILSFSALGGLFWEIYEFSIDQLFGTTMQIDNTDTMTDLIADVAGALVIALWIRIRAKRN